MIFLRREERRAKKDSNCCSLPPKQTTPDEIAAVVDEILSGTEERNSYLMKQVISKLGVSKQERCQ